MIDWLDAHQGAVMALLTLVYVLATITLVIVAIRGNRTAQRQLELAVDLERRRSRPYITFDLEPRKGLMYVTLRNSGITAAFNVKTVVTPKVEQVLRGQRHEVPLTKHIITTIPPGRVLEVLLDSSSSFFAQTPERLFSGRIEYHDESGHGYEELIKIDLAFWEHVTYTPDPNVAKEVEKVAQAIQALARTRS